MIAQVALCILRIISRWCRSSQHYFAFRQVCPVAAVARICINSIVNKGGDISMGKRFVNAAKWAGAALVAMMVFAGGYVAGQSRVGQPKTIIHVVEIKWNPGVSEVQKQKVLDGLKQVAMKTPGVKNVWTQADRLEPRDFNAGFAIEFQNRDAADAYAESALHDEWDKMYVPLRQTSISIQITNP
jgi:hypothetical protein